MLCRYTESLAAAAAAASGERRTLSARHRCVGGRRGRGGARGTETAYGYDIVVRAPGPARPIFLDRFRTETRRAETDAG